MTAVESQSADVGDTQGHSRASKGCHHSRCGRQMLQDYSQRQQHFKNTEVDKPTVLSCTHQLSPVLPKKQAVLHQCGCTHLHHVNMLSLNESVPREKCRALRRTSIHTSAQRPCQLFQGTVISRYEFLQLHLRFMGCNCIGRRWVPRRVPQLSNPNCSRSACCVAFEPSTRGQHQDRKQHQKP
eukprot:1160641-Pelagomonas_calceolata.AAC.12